VRLGEVLPLRQEDFEGETLQVRRTAHEGTILEGTKTDHGQFSAAAVKAAKARLGEYGFTPDFAVAEQAPPSLVPGSTFTVQVNVGEGGVLTLHLG
jgi:hypothetical protein